MSPLIKRRYGMEEFRSLTPEIPGAVVDYDRRPIFLQKRPVNSKNSAYPVIDVLSDLENFVEQNISSTDECFDCISEFTNMDFVDSRNLTPLPPEEVGQREILIQDPENSFLQRVRSSRLLSLENGLSNDFSTHRPQPIELDEKLFENDSRSSSKQDFLSIFDPSSSISSEEIPLG